MLDDIPEYMKGELETPATHRLFDVADDATKQSQTDAELFHIFVAQTLVPPNRALPDIQLGVSFLFTRFIYPDTNDYKNLERVMNYIQVNIGLLLIL